MFMHDCVFCHLIYTPIINTCKVILSFVVTLFACIATSTLFCSYNVYAWLCILSFNLHSNNKHLQSHIEFCCYFVCLYCDIHPILFVQCLCMILNFVSFNLHFNNKHLCFAEVIEFCCYFHSLATSRRLVKRSGHTPIIQLGVVDTGHEVTEN